MSSNSPFAPRRVQHDLRNALPALGMLLGAAVGVGLGFVRGVGGPVALGGAGIAVGLCLGLVLRVLLPRRE